MKEKMPKIIQIIVIIALIVLGIVIGDYYRPFKVGDNKPSVSVIEGELSEIAELASPSTTTPTWPSTKTTLNSTE